MFTHLRRIPVELDGTNGMEIGSDKSTERFQDGHASRTVIWSPKGKFRMHLELWAKKAPSAPVNSLSEILELLLLWNHTRGRKPRPQVCAVELDKITDESAQMASNASIPILVSADDNNAIIRRWRTFNSCNL